MKESYCICICNIYSNLLLHANPLWSLFPHQLIHFSSALIFNQSFLIPFNLLFKFLCLLLYIFHLSPINNLNQLRKTHLSPFTSSSILMALHLQQLHTLSTTRNHKVGEALVFGHFLQTTPCTLHLLHSDLSSFPVELDGSSPLPLGCQKFLDLKSGEIFYKGKRKHEESNKTMSRNEKAPELDLRLNLSPPRANHEVESPPPPPTSPLSSCISTENVESSSPEATSMVLVGCPRCMMYVMLSEEDPKCPKCKSPVLLDFLHENNNAKKVKKN